MIKFTIWLKKKKKIGIIGNLSGVVGVVMGSSLFYGCSILDMQITNPDLHLDYFPKIFISTGCSEGKRRKACTNTERSTKKI